MVFFDTIWFFGENKSLRISLLCLHTAKYKEVEIWALWIRSDFLYSYTNAFYWSMHIHVHTVHALYARIVYTDEILLNICNSGSMLHIYSHILQCEQPLQWHLIAFALLLGSSSPRCVPQWICTAEGPSGRGRHTRLQQAGHPGLSAVFCSSLMFVFLSKEGLCINSLVDTTLLACWNLFNLALKGASFRTDLFHTKF